MNRNLCFTILTIMFFIPIIYSIVNINTEITVSRLLINEKTYIILFGLFMIMTIFALEYEKMRKNRLSYYFMYFFSISCILFCFFHPHDKCHLMYAFVAFFAIVGWLFINAKNDVVLSCLLFIQLICSTYLFNAVLMKKRPDVFTGELIFLLVMFISYLYIHLKNK